MLTKSPERICHYILIFCKGSLHHQAPHDGMAKILPISENGFQLFRRTSTFLFFRTDINLDKNWNLAGVAACPFLYLFACLQALDGLDPVYPGSAVFGAVGSLVSVV